jgi:hypothetical protein
MLAGAGNRGSGGGIGQEPPYFQDGGDGGAGGFGFFDKPITQPFAQPFSVGGVGGNTTIANVGTVNGGGGSNAGPTNTPGSAGNAPGASFTYSRLGFVTAFVPNAAPASSRAGGDPPQPNNGNAGSGGALVVFENTGT